MMSCFSFCKSTNFSCCLQPNGLLTQKPASVYSQGLMRRASALVCAIMRGKTCDFENITFSEAQKNLIVEGRCYKIVDCIVSSEIKDENGRILDYPERKRKYFNSYYYIVKTPDDSLMFMKTSVHSKLTDMSDKLLLAAMQEESPYADMLESGIPVDGILIDLDAEFIRFFREWDSMGNYGSLSLYPYILDCKQPLFLRIIEFFG